jgi:hypothetical protein
MTFNIFFGGKESFHVLWLTYFTASFSTISAITERDMPHPVVVA